MTAARRPSPVLVPPVHRGRTDVPRVRGVIEDLLAGLRGAGLQPA